MSRNCKFEIAKLDHFIFLPEHVTGMRSVNIKKTLKMLKKTSTKHENE